MVHKTLPIKIEGNSTQLSLWNCYYSNTKMTETPQESHRPTLLTNIYVNILKTLTNKIQQYRKRPNCTP